MFIRIPPVGFILLILVYFGWVFGLQFYGGTVPGDQNYQFYSLRAAWLASAQFPLLILLSGKRNIISEILGVSYERLQIFHRYVGRSMLIFACLHWGYQQYGWSVYGVVTLERTTDSCVPTGKQ
jgi:ferric-chelate reductase